MDTYIVIAEGVIAAALTVALVILTGRHKSFLREKEQHDIQEKNDYLNELLENKARKSS